MVTGSLSFVRPAHVSFQELIDEYVLQFGSSETAVVGDFSMSIKSTDDSSTFSLTGNSTC
jgi:hypothetical protein